MLACIITLVPESDVAESSFGGDDDVEVKIGSHTEGGGVVASLDVSGRRRRRRFRRRHRLEKSEDVVDEMRRDS